MEPSHVALVPIRCPGCGASVELEQGQTVVRCGYCGETSAVARPRAPERPKPSTVSGHAASSGVTAKASRPTSRAAKIVVAFAVVSLIGLFGWIAYVGGVGMNYLEGGPTVRSFLVDQFGEDTRFVSIHLQDGYLHAKAIRADGTIVEQRFDGRSPRRSEPGGKADAKERALSFSLDDVDFDAVAKIARHARETRPDGTLAYILLSKQPPFQDDLFWAANVQVAGEYVRTLYDLEGEPLVEEPRNFFAAEASWFAPIEKKAGANLRIIRMTLLPEHATFEVMAAGSDRDTDSYTLHADGAVGTPTPQTTNGDAAELRKKVLRSSDIPWAVLANVVADAKKDGELQLIGIERAGAELEFTAHTKGKRGESRMVRYDRTGKRQPDR